MAGFCPGRVRVADFSRSGSGCEVLRGAAGQERVSLHGKGACEDRQAEARQPGLRRGRTANRKDGNVRHVHGMTRTESPWPGKKREWDRSRSG